MLHRRASLAAAVLLGLVVVGSSSVTAASRTRIDSTIADNARGAYDLLVTAGGQSTVSAAIHAGLIEQNFDEFEGAGGVSAAQLAAIRSLGGVDVAAPLSFVGNLSSPGYGVLVGARDPVGASSGFFAAQPKAFDVDVTITTSDGVQTQTLSSTNSTMVVARNGATGDAAQAILAASGVTSADTEDLSADVTIPGVPELSAGMVAVDPVAERELLGPGGAFLSPLATFDAQRARGAEASSLAALVPDRYGIERSALEQDSPHEPAMPVVVSDSAYAPLAAHVSITPLDLSGVTAGTLFGSTFGGATDLTIAGQKIVAHAARGRTETSVVDLTHEVVPFAAPAFSIALPGAAAGPGGAASTSAPALLPTLVSPATYTGATGTAEAPNGVALKLRAEARGYVRVSPTAQEQTYRPAGRYAPGNTLQFRFAPLGTYHPGDVSGTAADASYVPLGTYAADTATVTQPGPAVGARLGPSFSGLGLELAAPGAITSLSDLQSVRPGAGIDVVRVRVSGDRSYTPAVKAQIERVATGIADLGLTVRVVAGSSLAPVAVYVPHFYAPSSGTAQGSDLGWVRQEWTSLGAAVTVQRATLGATAWLFTLGLLVATFVAGTVQALALGSRRRETALLLQLGWTRGRVLRWWFAEGFLGVGIVAAASTVALQANARNPIALGVSVAGPALSMLLAAGAAWLGSRPASAPFATGGRRRATRRVRTVGAVGRRLATAERTTSAIVALSIIALGAAPVAFGAVLDEAHRAAGVSRLAGLVTTRLATTQALLAGVVLLASAVLFGIGTSVLRARAAPVTRILMSGGWSGRGLARLARATVTRAALPGFAAGTVVSAVLTITLDAARWWPLLALAIAVMGSAVLVSVLFAARQAHRLTKPPR